MTKHQLLRFISFKWSVSIPEVAREFDVSDWGAGAALERLKSDGEIIKIRENGRRVYKLGGKGKDKLEYFDDRGCRNLECPFCKEELEDLDFEEKENKRIGGNNTMPRTQYLEDGVYQCPSCGCKYDLEDVTVDSDDALCEECGEELDLVEPFENSEDEDEPEVRKRGR